MKGFIELDRIAITVKAHRVLKQLLKENPILEEIMQNARNETEALEGVREWVTGILQKNHDAWNFYLGIDKGREAYEKLTWSDYAAIRILDYIDNAGISYEDLNLRGEKAISDPVKLIWLAVTFGTGGAKPSFFEDMLYLFRQFSGSYVCKKPSTAMVEKWMDRYPSGLDPRIVRLREENRDRIIGIMIEMIDSGELKDSRFFFEEGMTHGEKRKTMLGWWKEGLFHLRFAVRSPDLLNRMLGNSLDPDTMKILYEAEAREIPFFVNPYYLSLLHVRVPYFAIGADLAIRYYVLYSQQLVDEFGKIVAWEKEDLVEPGKPNAAGWLLPTHNNVHRRYPEVAILIPDTMGRACGGLCASCQRMFDFQSGHLNFNLEKLKPDEKWSDKLERIMEYFENDSQLRDILITGGDSLMSSNKSLERILESVLQMSERKRNANLSRPPGEKYAEIIRVRLGTRLPAYLPQRIDDELLSLLRSFKERASGAGVKQFLIQTHFESPLEVTPEAETAVKGLISAGWIVVNQLVFTSAGSRRGHTARLRQVLNEIGVLPYYTFTVKGYMENNFNFATNARAVQEQVEEKVLGKIPVRYYEKICALDDEPERMIEGIADLKRKAGLPFLATDRNVLNLPGVGKSLTYRVVGITRYGRRILRFEHDQTRLHSPIINKMGSVIIIESKSISEYLRQLEEIGENASEYESIWGYSIGETEPRSPLYEYPEGEYSITHEYSNLMLE